MSDIRTALDVRDLQATYPDLSNIKAIYALAHAAQSCGIEVIGHEKILAPLQEVQCKGADVQTFSSDLRVLLQRYALSPDIHAMKERDQASLTCIEPYMRNGKVCVIGGAAHSRSTKPIQSPDAYCGLNGLLGIPSIDYVPLKGLDPSVVAASVYLNPTGPDADYKIPLPARLEAHDLGQLIPPATDAAPRKQPHPRQPTSR